MPPCGIVLAFPFPVIMGAPGVRRSLPSHHDNVLLFKCPSIFYVRFTTPFGTEYREWA